MATVTINGSIISGARNVTIKNGRVIIDGKDVTEQGDKISINVEGNLDSLTVDFCRSLEVKGNVHKLDSAAGNVTCGNVTGGLETASGDVECGSVGGDVETASGDVKVTGDITGDVETMSGDVTANTIKGSIETMSGAINANLVSGGMKM